MTSQVTIFFNSDKAFAFVEAMWPGLLTEEFLLPFRRNGEEEYVEMMYELVKAVDAFFDFVTVTFGLTLFELSRLNRDKVEGLERTLLLDSQVHKVFKFNLEKVVNATFTILSVSEIDDCLFTAWVNAGNNFGFCDETMLRGDIDNLYRFVRRFPSASFAWPGSYSWTAPGGENYPSAPN